MILETPRDQDEAPSPKDHVSRKRLVHTWRESLSRTAYVMNTILGLDPGNFKTVACFFNADDGVRYVTVESHRTGRGARRTVRSANLEANHGCCDAPKFGHCGRE
jgi:hypothetical protein